jgi:hypothetical protein
MENKVYSETWFFNGNSLFFPLLALGFKVCKLCYHNPSKNFQSYSTWVSNDADFEVDFESVEKVTKYLLLQRIRNQHQTLRFFISVFKCTGK